MSKFVSALSLSLSLLALTLLQGEESVGNSGDSHVLPGRPSLNVAASLAFSIFQMKGKGPVDFGGQVDFGDQLTLEDKLTLVTR